METPVKTPQQLRLVFQGSMPVISIEYAEDIYNDLKIFLQSISPNMKLAGQITKMLETCCKDFPKGKT
jgi:hypothetical protein